MGSMASVQDSNVQRVEIPGNFADKSPRLPPKTKSDYSKPETLINLLPNITEDTCTVGTRGCCQHDDEPLLHFLYDQLEDQNNFFSGIMQRSAGSAGLQRRSFSDSTHPPFEGTRLIKNVFRKGLQALILKISMLLKFAGRYRHVVILMAILILIQVACAVSIDCTSVAVITSPQYPATYPQFIREDWFLTAPEGKRILLTFNYFSLGSSDEVEVIDPADDQNRQRYSGEKNTIPQFMSRRNGLILRFTSNGNPTGNGFNISASCYKLPATVGFCNQTDNVMNGSWDSNITWFGSIVHLTCDDGYRLKGNGTLQCGTEVSSQIHVWIGSIPRCEMIPDTLPVTSGPDNAGIAISSSMTTLYMCIICAAVVHLMQLQ